MAITLTITDLESLSAKQRKTVTQFIEAVANDDAGSACTGSGKCHDHGFNADEIAESKSFAEARAENLRSAESITAAMAAFGPKSNATSTVAVEAPTIAPEVAPVTTTTSENSDPVQQTDSVEAAQTEPAAPTNLVNGVEVDSTGLPWDIRIHASNKARAKAGTWVRKRNVDDADFNRIEAQLRAAMTAPAVPMVTPALPPVPQVSLPPLPPVIPAIIPTLPEQPAQTVFNTALPPLTPAVEVATPAIPTPPASMSFLQLVTAVTPLVQSGKLTQGELNEVLASVGITELRLLATRPDLVPQVENILRISGKL